MKLEKRITYRATEIILTVPARAFRRSTMPITEEDVTMKRLKEEKTECKKENPKKFGKRS